MGAGRPVGAGRRSRPRRRGRRSARARARAREGAWPTARCARGGCPGRLGRGRGRDGGRRRLRRATRCGDPEIRTRGLAEDHAPARGAVVSAGHPLPPRGVRGPSPALRPGPSFSAGQGPGGGDAGGPEESGLTPAPRERDPEVTSGGSVGGAEGRPGSRDPGGRARRGEGCRTGKGGVSSGDLQGEEGPVPRRTRGVTLGEGVHTSPTRPAYSERPPPPAPRAERRPEGDTL